MQVHVPPALFDEIEAIYAPPDHPVFELVPHPLGERFKMFYEEIGQPTVTHDGFWDIYSHLLRRFHALGCAGEFAHLLEIHEESERRIQEERVDLLPGLKELRMGANVIGARGHGVRADGDILETDRSDEYRSVADELQYATFTDSEFSDSDSG